MRKLLLPVLLLPALLLFLAALPGCDRHEVVRRAFGTAQMRYVPKGVLNVEEKNGFVTAALKQGEEEHWTVPPGDSPRKSFPFVVFIRSEQKDMELGARWSRGNTPGFTKVIGVRTLEEARPFRTLLVRHMPESPGHISEIDATQSPICFRVWANDGPPYGPKEIPCYERSDGKWKRVEQPTNVEERF